MSIANGLLIAGKKLETDESGVGLPLTFEEKMIAGDVHLKSGGKRTSGAPAVKCGITFVWGGEKTKTFGESNGTIGVKEGTFFCRSKVNKEAIREVSKFASGSLEIEFCDSGRGFGESDGRKLVKINRGSRSRWRIEDFPPRDSTGTSKPENNDSDKTNTSIFDGTTSLIGGLSECGHRLSIRSKGVS